MTDTTKVAILITKLLALARDGGATEAEAALAAEKAQELMTEHNLSMASVEAAGGQSGDEGQRVKDGIRHRQVYKWQRVLMNALADLNFCYCQEKYETGRGFNRVFDGYMLIGRSANVAAVRVMFEYLLQTIDRLARADVQDGAKLFTRYAHSFKEGCADRVIERLRERRAREVEVSERKAREDKARAAHPASAGTTALVVVLGDYVQDEKDLNEDMRKGLPPGTTKQKRLDDRAAQRVKRDQRRTDILATRPDIDPDGDLFDWLVDGLSEEQYYRATGPSKPETDAQRRKRRDREQREQDRWYNQQYRQDAKRDRHGYDKGRQAGDGVGLDQQVSRNSPKGIT